MSMYHHNLQDTIETYANLWGDGVFAMFDALSSTTWKLISGSLVAIILFLGMTVAVKSCQYTDKDNERLNQINELKDEVSFKTQEVEDMKTRITGLQSEIEHQKSVITSRDAEIQALSQRQESEITAIETGKNVTEKVHETIKNDEEATNWFDQKIPESILNALLGLNDRVDDALFMQDRGNKARSGHSGTDQVCVPVRQSPHSMP